jgi:hypothetical protein
MASQCPARSVARGSITSRLTPNAQHHPNLYPAMKPYLRIVMMVVFAVVATTRLFANANAIGDIVKAQIVINKVLDVVAQFHEQTVVVDAPAPIATNKGKYLLPYKANGEMTEWAGKALNVEVAKLAGEKAGDAVASKIPFGGFASGLIKKKTKEVAAVTALGGMNFLKSTSELSFDSLNEYAVYLHVRHSTDANYKEVLAAAMALYPDLEGRFDGAVKEAYQQQAAKVKKTG